MLISFYSYSTIAMKQFEGYQDVFGNWGDAGVSYLPHNLYSAAHLQLTQHVTSDYNYDNGLVVSCGFRRAITHCGIL